jgi:hypothetical protein
MVENSSSGTAQCRLPERFFTKSDLDRMFKNRKIYIYGAGNDGRGIFHALKRNGFNVEAFIDRSTILTGGGGDILVFLFFLRILFLPAGPVFRTRHILF